MTTQGLSILEAAAESPDRPALVAEDAALTFAELARRAEPEVARLRARHGPGNPVAIVAHSDVATLARLHALIATGTPAVLLHPRSTGPERERLLERVRASGRVGDAATGPERTLAVVFTSGTSGRPKGVLLSRRAFVASADASAANLGWQENDRWLLPLPVAHVGGLSIVTRCLLARRAVVLAENAEPARLLEVMEGARVTLASLVPTLLSRILELGTVPPPRLRAVLLGGAPASPALLERAADAGWPVLTTYGLTEACSQVTTQEYGTVNRGEAGAGAPLPGIGVRVRAGEIEVRGPTLFSGYLDGDEDRPRGWFATGDRGRFDGRGRLHVLGRRSDRIVTGGENVDPVEVERALERLPGVRAACVFGVPDEEWGEVVCAAVVPEPSSSLVVEPGRAMAALRDELAGYKVPRRVALLESLPSTPNGKVDRRETARIARSRLRPI